MMALDRIDRECSEQEMLSQTKKSGNQATKSLPQRPQLRQGIINRLSSLAVREHRVHRLVWRWMLQPGHVPQRNVERRLVKELKCRKRLAHMLPRCMERLPKQNTASCHRTGQDRLSYNVMKPTALTCSPHTHWQLAQLTPAAPLPRLLHPYAVHSLSTSTTRDSVHRNHGVPVRARHTQRLHRGGHRRAGQRNRGDHAQRALAAYEQLLQVVPAQYTQIEPHRFRHWGVWAADAWTHQCHAWHTGILYVPWNLDSK